MIEENKNSKDHSQEENKGEEENLNLTSSHRSSA